MNKAGIVFLLLFVWRLDSLAAQIDRSSLPPSVQEILSQNDDQVARRQLSFIEVDMLGDRTHETFKFWSAPGIRRRVSRESSRTRPSNPFELIRERDIVRDLQTGIVRCYSAPSMDVLHLITPCQTQKAGAAIGPWSGDIELLPLGSLLLMVPVRVIQFVTLSDYVERIATEFEDLGLESLGDHQCVRWRFHHLDEAMLHGGPPMADFWISTKYPGLIMRFRIVTEFHTPRGVFYAGRDYQVETIKEISAEVAVPEKVNHFWFETQSADYEANYAELLKKVLVTELLTFEIDVLDKTEFADPSLGFRFPKLLPVQVKDVDLSDGVSKAKETIIYGDSEDEIILRTTEDRIWLNDWCIENGYPGTSRAAGSDSESRTPDASSSVPQSDADDNPAFDPDESQGTIDWRIGSYILLIVAGGVIVVLWKFRKPRVTRDS